MGFQEALQSPYRRGFMKALKRPRSSWGFVKPRHLARLQGFMKPFRKGLLEVQGASESPSGRRFIKILGGIAKSLKMSFVKLHGISQSPKEETSWEPSASRGFVISRGFESLWQLSWNPKEGSSWNSIGLCKSTWKRLHEASVLQELLCN